MSYSVLSYFCPMCKWASLEEHPEFKYYYKCKICGYTEEQGDNEDRVEEKIKSLKLKN